MTNRQFFDAVQVLGQEGKISQDEQSKLSMIAQGVDYAPITGAYPSVAQMMADPTKHDFISHLQGDDYTAHSAGAIRGDLYDRMLADLLNLTEAPCDAMSQENRSSTSLASSEISLHRPSSSQPIV